MNNQKTELWTDGSAVPNPGKGGYAVLDAKGNAVALGGSEADFEAQTTNIRMEARALIAALKHCQANPEGHFAIHTDSEFWINVVTKWAPGWAEKGWQKKGGPIKNLDLVRELYALYTGTKNAELKWVRGHVGTELNEKADEWANRARQGTRL